MKKETGTAWFIRIMIRTAIIMCFFTAIVIESGSYTLSWSTFFKYLFAWVICFYGVALSTSAFEDDP